MSRSDGKAGISRRGFIVTTGSVAAAAALTQWSCSEKAAEPASEPPNLVFVFPDQFRRYAMGFMNADPVITPNLDRFASESLVLTNATSNFPLCSPYRAMMLTGKYPASNGVRTNCNSAHTSLGVFLKPEERCISDVLHDAGYHLGYIGKWHLEAPHEPYVEPPRPWDGCVWDEWTPPGAHRHGFDFWHSYGCYDEHLKPHYWTTEATRDQRTEVNEWSPRHEADVAIDFIRRRDRKRPFGLFVAMNPPHPPYQLVPPEYVERYGDKTAEQLLNRGDVNLSDGSDASKTAREQAKNYFAAVTGVDEQFGRILQCLEEEGLAENTVVVFTSDHGEMMGSHDRMQKSVWYEEAIGIPFLLRWKGKVQPRRDDLLLSVPDVMPTLLGLMGLEGKIPSQVEGSNHSSLVLGGDGKRPTSAPYILMPPAPRYGETTDERGLRTLTHTFVVRRKKGKDDEYLLFDNRNDRYQLKNVAEDNRELVRELMAELQGWFEWTGDPWLKG